MRLPKISKSTSRLPAIILNTEGGTTANVRSVSLRFLNPKDDPSQNYLQKRLKINSLRFYATILSIFCIGFCK